MPIITAEGPRIDDLDRKREYVKRLTEAAADAYGMPPEKIIVSIKDTLPENIAVGGELIIDRRKGDE